MALYSLTGQPMDYEASADSLLRINWSISRLKRNVLVQSSSFPDQLQNVFKPQSPQSKRALARPVGAGTYDSQSTTPTNRTEAGRAYRIFLPTNPTSVRHFRVCAVTLTLSSGAGRSGGKDEQRFQAIRPESATIHRVFPLIVPSPLIPYNTGTA